MPGFAFFRFLVVLSFLLAQLSAQGIITTIAGTDFVPTGDNTPATQAQFAGTLGFGLALDANENLYIADGGSYAVFRVTPSGILTTVAGNGIASYSGDGGPARSASLTLPQAIAFDSAGNLYIADALNNVVRRVTRDGVITTIAGNGSAGFAGDGGLALAASMTSPDSIAVDSAGNIFVGSANDNRIRKFTPGGIITTVAGTGQEGYSGDGGPGAAAAINFPQSLATDAAGNLYFADSGNGRIRKINLAGFISTVVGGGQVWSLAETPALESYIYPVSVVIDRTGTLFFGDQVNYRVARLTSSGTVVTVAGNGENKDSGDGGPALKASLSYPASVTVDSAGTLYIADGATGRVRKVSVSGQISPFAGNGKGQFGGDNGPGVLAVFSLPERIAFDLRGNLLIADFANHRLRRLDTRGIVTTVAGTGGISEFFNIENPAGADLPYPAGIAVDGTGAIYVTDRFGGLIRKITADGKISIFAGTVGSDSFSGDNGPALRASLLYPSALKLDAAGNLYVVDTGNRRVRKIGLDGIITTVAGGGTTLGDGGPATRASLNLRIDSGAGGGLAFDAAGNLYIADTNNHRIRMVTASGMITTVAGNGRAGYSGDNGPAINASLNGPVGIFIDRDGNLLIADKQNNRIRKVTRGVITTIAGNGRRDFKGDGGLAVDASLRVPNDVISDAAGNVYVADEGNNRVRQILVTPPTFDISATSLTFSARSGGAPSQPQLLLVSSSVPGLPFSVSATTTAGGNWLTVTPLAGATPRRIEISANPANLPSGTYRGTITITAPNASPSSRTVAVQFQVAAGSAPALSVDKGNVSFTFPRSAAPRSDVITVANSGGGILNFTATASTTTGGNWLSVSPASGAVSPVTPAVVAIRANPSNLAPGSYSGQITITASTGETRRVSVTMTISEAEKALALTQTGLAFTTVANGGAVPPKTFGVLNVGNGRIIWTVSASTLSGGSGWLQVSPASGTTEASQPAPVVEVRVNQTGLAPGSYYGLLRVDYAGDNPAEAANSPQFLTVFLQVLPSGSDPGPLIEPSELIFTGVSGAPYPGSKEVLLYNISANPKTFRSVLSSGSDNFTLSAPPRDGTLLPGQPARIIVQPRVDNMSTDALFTLTLPPGVYSRELAFQFSDGTVQTVNVRLIVTPPAPAQRQSKLSPQAVTGCSPTKLLPAVTSLAQSFAVSAGWPVALTVNVQDDCGQALDDGFVSVSFSNGDPPVLLQSLKQGRWQGSWAARNSTSQVTLKVDAADPQGALTGSRELSGNLSSAQDAPFTDKDRIVSAASFQQFVPVAPGGMISIFGDRLAENTAAAQTLPLPTSLAGTEIVMAGRQLPLLFVSQTQLNAVVPSDINVNTSQQILIRRGVTLSRPVSVDVAAAQPAVFMANSAPIVVNASASTTTPVLVSGSAPAKAGDVLILYTSGLGRTNPPVTDGASTPNSPLSPTRDPVKVTIGGVDAPVLFSGLVPGFAAFYQINVMVPAGVSGASQVPLVLNVSGQTSPPVMLNVQ